MTSYVSVTDLFCGSGGSSEGMAQVSGVEIKHAANHWQLALETHAKNHPDTEHFYCDIQETHPSVFRKTTGLWASPSCTNHTVAKGRKRKGIDQFDLWGENGIDPEEEKSRATMMDVVAFTEYYRYEFVIVENVTEARAWRHYSRWLDEMQKLGYRYKEVIFNSMFSHPVPQSRDRLYVVFWKKGNKTPDLEIRPKAYCHHCECNVESIFSPKGHRLPSRVLYGKSYVYRCPTCAQEVTPYHYAAINALNFTLPMERIGDRKKPLAPNTLKRIQQGIDKYKGKWMVIDMSHPKEVGRVYSVDMAHPTVTTRNNYALAMPFILSYYTRKDASRSTDQPLPTIPTENRHSLIMPMPIVSTFRTPDTGRSVQDALTTVIGSAVQQSVIMPQPFNAPYYGNSTAVSHADALPTVTGNDHHNLVLPNVSWELEDCFFRMLDSEEVKLAMGFPESYIVLGNKAQQVKQSGNAVCPPTARMLMERVVASLEGQLQ